MTEKNTPTIDEAGEVVEPVRYFVEVQGRRIELGTPDATQLATMRLVASRLSRMDAATASGEQVVRALQKMIQLVTVLPRDPEDGDWLEDLLIRRAMGIDEASQFVTDAALAWEQGGNREQRRAAAKKAARKAPARR